MPKNCYKSNFYGGISRRYLQINTSMKKIKLFKDKGIAFYENDNNFEKTQSTNPEYKQLFLRFNKFCV